MLKYKVRKRNEASLQLKLPIIDETQQLDEFFDQLQQNKANNLRYMQNVTVLNFTESKYTTEFQYENAATALDIHVEHELLNIIAEDTFEAGYISDTERYIDALLKSDSQNTRMIINAMFLKYINRTNILVGILHAISHLDYRIIYPEGPTMAIAALSHQNIEVREWGIRAFENWGDPLAVNILLKIRCRESWLDDYRLAVIDDLSRGR